MFQIKAKIVYNKRVKDNYFHLVLRAPRITKESHPGQFLNIRISDVYEPLLRRPFSIHRVKGANIEMIYEVVGRATALLSQKKTGEYLDIIGPLGNGFDYYPLSAKRYPLLIAGGMGVAPLLFLAEKLAHSVECIAYRKNKRLGLSAKRYPLNAKVLIGAKTKSHILCEREFKQLGYEVKIATDDGSRGFKGKVTDLLIHELSAKRYPLSAIIYACGPKPMLKEISSISKEYNLPAQLSLEAHMACGFGACLGCAVNTIEGYKRVCKEGPVFNAEEVII